MYLRNVKMKMTLPLKEPAPSVFRFKVVIGRTNTIFTLERSVVVTESGDRLVSLAGVPVRGLFRDVADFLMAEMNWTADAYAREDGVWGIYDDKHGWEQTEWNP